MTVRASLVLIAATALLGAGAEVVRLADPAPSTVGASDGEPTPDLARAPSDSALDELAVGRYWHAARILRAEGASMGEPDEVLALARAEAGWENWIAVLELLRGRPWLDLEGAGAGERLLARAFEEAGRWEESATAYGRYVARIGRNGPEGMAASARRARVLWEAGRRNEALEVLGTLLGSPSVRSWGALELVLAASEEGDTAMVRQLLVHVVEPGARAATWRVSADTKLAAGDSAGATEAYRALFDANTGSRRGDIAVRLGRLRLAAGDTPEARTLLQEGFANATPAFRTEAAASLVDLGGFDLDRTLDFASTLDRAGDGARALKAYDRAHALASAGGQGLATGARLERARLMSSVDSRQAEALAEFRAIDESTDDESLAARNLALWRDLRSRQGLNSQAATLRGWLLERYPGSSQAVELVWTEGVRAEDRGQLDTALERYAFIAEHARTSSRAGESRMRSGQIHLRRADRERAAEVYEQYLSDFPDGRRWPEAAYWAGRVRMELGDTAAARRHLGRALREQPIEYYAVMSAELLGVRYDIEVPEGTPPSEPAWLSEGLGRLDLLSAAGLERGAAMEIERLRDRADGSRAPTLRLAEALIERGRTIDGINLGWALLDAAGTWDRQLLLVTFPFPYQELVRREAREWGVDPLMLASIIRQESAFKADIVSRAGAIGLMQVMPPTGAQLARAHGPDPFDEGALARPEVNLHLGAAFFVEMSARYDDDLPLVLSAYNAGPTRANRWRQFPEAADASRLTERIPFDETRGYVKNVRRNLGLYQALYGQD